MSSQRRRRRSRVPDRQHPDTPQAGPQTAKKCAGEKRALAERSSSWRGAFWLSVLLIGATLVVYAQACRFGFVLIDDPVYASENPHVQAGLSPTNFAWSFTTFRDGNWIPFTWLSLMLDTTVFGVRPGGYHVTNVLLHVVNTL